MKLNKLLKGIKVLNKDEVKNINIENVSNRTTDNLANGLYVCIKGANFDGHNLKQEALKRGAVAFVVEEYDYTLSCMQILVDDSRKALSILAKNFYGAKIPKVIGITGTNGKTTTSNMVAHILAQNNIKVGLIGTEGVFFDNKKINFNMTTPDPIDLFKVLGQMYECGVKFAVMEVSAHSIALNKIHALDFYIKALTNITEDHLDFFKNLEAYQKSKIGYITSGNGIKIVNIDDKYGCKVASKNENVCTYSRVMPADAYSLNINAGASEFLVAIDGEKMEVKTRLIGLYNVSNALCAMLICKKIGLSLTKIVNSFSTFKAVEGRLNVFYKDNKTAVLDFAHTPDALKNVLSTLKSTCKNKLYCVFGCGGNREAEKRPIMGEVATSICDYVYITTDNPRFEEPEFIINQITSGIKKKNYEVVMDRETAIKMANYAMKDGDILAVCGKGAEDYIEIKGQKYPYSDKKVLESLGYKIAY